jgi:hypothetical protein
MVPRISPSLIWAEAEATVIEDHGSVQRCAWAVAGRLQERLERKLLGFGEANPVPILCEAKPIAILSRPAALTY